MYFFVPQLCFVIFIYFFLLIFKVLDYDYDNIINCIDTDVYNMWIIKFAVSSQLPEVIGLYNLPFCSNSRRVLIVIHEIMLYIIMSCIRRVIVYLTEVKYARRRNNDQRCCGWSKIHPWILLCVVNEVRKGFVTRGRYSWWWCRRSWWWSPLILLLLLRQPNLSVIIYYILCRHRHLMPPNDWLLFMRKWKIVLILVCAYIIYIVYIVFNNKCTRTRDFCESMRRLRYYGIIIIIISYYGIVYNIAKGI